MFQTRCKYSNHVANVSNALQKFKTRFKCCMLDGFSIRYNGKFEIFDKNSLKIRNSKFQKSPT